MRKLITCTLAFVLIVFGSKYTYDRYSPKTDIFSISKFNFDFVPVEFVNGVSKCDELFTGSAPAKEFNMSDEYEKSSPGFMRATKELGNVDKGKVEGFSHQMEAEYKTLHYLASHRSARRICETGFNFGHSSFGYLTANPSSRVYSFDLGNHNYSRPLAKFLSGMYPRRFTATFGDSIETIPKFAAEQRSNFRCDMILVDGGHTYEVARADIINFSRLANLANNVIIFDDHPTIEGKLWGKAWDELVEKGLIREVFRCTFKKKLDRGFVIGHILRHPD